MPAGKLTGRTWSQFTGYETHLIEMKTTVVIEGCCCSMFSNQRRGVESKAYSKESGTLQPDMYGSRRVIFTKVSGDL